jgi:hypothetical protein
MTMRKILTLILTTIFINSNAQTKLLSKYPFDKGGYAIVGLLSESDPSDLQKQLGEFYTDDIKVLNDFKKAWTFSKKSPMYACGYHYSIQVTHNGTILESFLINLNCNVIATDNGYFYFDTKKLSQFKDRLKKPTKRKRSFNTILEGKNYISTIKKDKTLLLTFEPVWTKFEGEFTFKYKNPDKKDDNDVVAKRLKTEIKKLYPNEDFTINEIMWGSGGEYEFEIICNKSLYDKFTVYPKKKSWEVYKPTLTTYWK